MKKNLFVNHDNDMLKIGIDSSHKLKIKKDINTLSASSYDCLNIYKQLAYGKKSEITDIINQIRKLTKYQPLSFLHYVFLDVLFTCTRYTSEIGGDITSILPDTANYNHMLNSITSHDELCIMLNLLLNSVYDYRDKHTDILQGNTIARAQKYIDANFTLPTISLNSVAQECNVSPNHLSFLFSKYSGITFIDYLTKLRISKAQELLANTNIHISDISYSVGYNDSHHFSHIFKKHTGISPSQYRKSYRSGYNL